MAYQPFVPADVPANVQEQFIKRYQRICKNTDRLFVFVVDHKFEHLNEDFYGPEISDEVQDPQHIFEIAQLAEIGAFATHPGLIERYAKEYPTISYIMKLNGKTNLTNQTQEPFSAQLWSVEQAVMLAQSANISLCGIGLTVYIGSEFEAKMLEQAAQVVYQAHQQGLIAMLWMYPRGKAVKSPEDPQVTAGAAGLANALGADFVKIHAPLASGGKTSEQHLQQAVAAAGNTSVLCSGGKRADPTIILETIAAQMKIGGTKGCAVGRNIFQLPLDQAKDLVKKISAQVYG